MKQKILILDDDANSRKFLSTLLADEFELMAFPCSNQDPLKLIDTHQPILVILDSFILCKKIKSSALHTATPVMVLSSRNTASDIAEGLTLGAQDFMTKPFDHKELKLRVKTQIKNTLAVVQSKHIQVGDLEIDTEDRTARFKGVTLNLTLTEYDILRLLASRCGQTISRDEMMKSIWKNEAEEITDRTIDVHIRSLRKKVPELSNHIKSVYGVGYQYQE